MKVKDAVVAMLVALLWGAQVTAVKIGGQEIPPILMSAFRFIVMAALLIPYFGLPKRNLWKPVLCIASLSGALHFGLLYSGISSVDASTSAVAYQISTPFTLLLAFAVLGERITSAVIAGIALAFVGVLIVMNGVGEGGAIIGIMLVILAALAFAFGTILTKKWGPFDPAAMNGWVAMVAAPELLVMSAFYELDSWQSVTTASSSAWIAVVYTAISGGLIGFGLWYWLLARNPVHRLAPFTLLVPVFAVVVSQIFLYEPLTTNLVIGGGVVLTGVALCQIKGTGNKFQFKIRLTKARSNSAV